MAAAVSALEHVEQRQVNGSSCAHLIMLPVQPPAGCSFLEQPPADHTEAMRRCSTALVPYPNMQHRLAASVLRSLSVFGLWRHCSIQATAAAAVRGQHIGGASKSHQQQEQQRYQVV